MQMAAIFGEILTLILMATALGMDAFSIGLGMGMYKLCLKRIFLIGLIVGFFHVWMPLIGIVTGKFLTTAFGVIAGYIGGGLLVILGLQMLFSSFRTKENHVISPLGWGVILFAISVSLDSFSVGMTLGIFGARTAVALICFGVVAATLTWSGLLIAKKAQRVLGAYSEALGGSILLTFGITLLIPL